MKKNYTILVILLSFAYGQVIVSTDGQKAALPRQFAVTPEGIQAMVSGQSTPMTTPWSRINLDILAKTEPEIEKARKEAVLKGSRIYFEVQPPPNYYREFLNAPVNVQFNQSWDVKQTSWSRYRYSTEGYADISPTATGASVSYS